MNRKVQRTSLGASRERVKVSVSTQPCDPTGNESWRMRQHLLESVVMVPHLTHCGYAPFEVLRIFHDGTSWVAEATATIDTAGGTSSQFGSGEGPQKVE